MSFLHKLISDVVDRKLWPVAVALAVALVAAPLLIGRSSRSQGAAPATPSPAASSAGSSGTSRVAVSIEPAPVGAHDSAGAVRDPFKGPRVKQASAPAAQKPAQPSTAGGGASGGGSAGSPGAPSGGAPSTPTPSPTPAPAKPKTDPSAPTDALDTYHLTLRFGEAGGLKTIKDVARLAALPSADNPFFVYLGVLEDGKTAVFLVSSDAKATGDGHCRPSPQDCETIELQQGDTEFFDLTVAGQPVQYQMDVIRVQRTKAASTNATAAAVRRHSNIGAELLRDAHVRGDKAFAGADAYRWLPDLGVLIRPPKKTGARASATAGSTHVDTAAVAGEPVWHWKIHG